MFKVLWIHNIYDSFCIVGHIVPWDHMPQLKNTQYLITSRELSSCDGDPFTNVRANLGWPLFRWPNGGDPLGVTPLGMTRFEWPHWRMSKRCFTSWYSIFQIAQAAQLFYLDSLRESKKNFPSSMVWWPMECQLAPQTMWSTSWGSNQKK